MPKPTLMSSRWRPSRCDKTAKIAAFGLILCLIAALSARAQGPPPDGSWMADAIVEKVVESN